MEFASTPEVCGLNQRRFANQGVPADPEQQLVRLTKLRNERPRSRFLRASILLMVLLSGYAWTSGEIAVGDLFSARRMENLQRFLEKEATPRPLRESIVGIVPGTGIPSEQTSQISLLFDWAGDLWHRTGAEAVVATSWIAILAMVLAGCYGLLSSPFGARTLMHSDPFLGDSRGWVWRLTSSTFRMLAVFMRAIPEFVWAFLFLSMLGRSAWPAVLALWIHNAGILSRLSADMLEDLPARPARSLRMLGATRAQIAIGSMFSTGLPRFLLYFFYRLETCVREATVLGMLGVISLGYWIEDARARGHYDEMLYLVSLGAMMVLIADWLSWWARRLVRNSGLKK
jgi:phosphonate transport system permease protein